MKCEDFEQRLNLVLDERRRPEGDEELRQHTERCAACRELSAAYTLLLDGFHALTMPEAPADLSVRVLDEWKARPATTRRLAVISAVLTTAAAVAVAVYLPWRSGADRPQVAKVSPPSASPTVPAPAVAKSAAAPSAAAPSAAAPSVAPNSAVAQSAAVQKADRPAAKPTELPPIDWQELDDLPLVGPVLVSMSDNDEKTDPYAALAKGTGQSLASVVLYMPGVGPKGLVVPQASTRGIFPAQVSEELRPVTESMTETLNLLLRAVPLSTAPAAPRKAS